MASSSEQRSALMGLIALALSDLAGLWDEVTNRSGDVQQGDLSAASEELTGVYGLAAGALAADWYMDLREAAGVAGRFTAAPAEMPTSGLFQWMADEVAAGPDGTALTRAQGFMQKAVASAHRETITQSSNRDPKAYGWRRIGVGANCPWCNALISRGAVYKESTARFSTHEHCNCVAEPAFHDGPAMKVLPYIRSDRAQTPARRAAMKRWIAENQ